MKKLTTTILTTIATFFTSATLIAAQGGITNPALPGQDDPAEAASGGLFVYYFVYFWNTIITVGALATLGYFVWAAMEWVTSGGDKGKLESARGRMVNAFIGMIILGSSYILVAGISFLLGMDLLAPQFFAPDPS